MYITFSHSVQHYSITSVVGFAVDIEKEEVMSAFRLQLNPPPNGVYFPGMTVSGTVILVTEKPKDYKNIEVRIVGDADVYWTETRHSTGTRHSTTVSGNNHNQRTETVTYHSHETYIDTFVRVWDKEACGSSSFPVGSHSFPFSLQLVGNNLPPSYEGTVGRIRYTLTSKIVKSGLLKRNKTCEAVLTVASVVDINTPSLQRPKAMEVQKNICCLCCASGSIVITARIPRSGCCAVTDAIPLDVIIENGSDRNICNVAATLRKVVQYTARGKHRYDSVKLASIVSDRITAHGSLAWCPTPLSVPGTVPTILSCEIIKVYYLLDIVASVPWAINPSISFPITIGNVPLQSDHQPLEPYSHQPLEHQPLLPYKLFNS